MWPPGEVAQTQAGIGDHNAIVGPGRTGHDATLLLLTRVLQTNRRALLLALKLRINRLVREQTSLPEHEFLLE